MFNSKAVPDLFSYNDFPGITGLPKIEPGQIQTPSLKELSLILRAMGLNIAGDIELQKYLRRILGMPDLDEDTFERVYSNQGAEETPNNTGVNKPSTTAGDFNDDDTVDNDFEQSDQDYTGGVM